MVWTTYCKVGGISCCLLLNQHKPYCIWFSIITKFPKNRVSIKKIHATLYKTQSIIGLYLKYFWFDTYFTFFVSHKDKRQCVRHIFSLSTRWQWVFSIMLHQICLHGKRSMNILCRRIGEPHSCCVYGGKEINLYPCQKSKMSSRH
jgi:hypothetical protein